MMKKRVRRLTALLMGGVGFDKWGECICWF